MTNDKLPKGLKSTRLLLQSVLRTVERLPASTCFQGSIGLPITSDSATFSFKPLCELVSSVSGPFRRVPSLGSFGC